MKREKKLTNSSTIRSVYEIKCNANGWRRQTGDDVCNMFNSKKRKEVFLFDIMHEPNNICCDSNLLNGSISLAVKWLGMKRGNVRRMMFEAKLAKEMKPKKK